MIPLRKDTLHIEKKVYSRYSRTMGEDNVLYSLSLLKLILLIRSNIAIFPVNRSTF